MAKNFGDWSTLRDFALWGGNKTAEKRVHRFYDRTKGMDLENDYIKSFTDKGEANPFANTWDDDSEYRQAENYAANQEAITGHRTLKGFDSGRGEKSVFASTANSGGKESKRNKAMLKQIDAHRAARTQQIVDLKGQATQDKVRSRIAEATNGEWEKTFGQM